MSDKGGIVWREPFDVKGDKTGKDPMYLDNIRSGHVVDNTHHRKPTKGHRELYGRGFRLSLEGELE